MTTTLTLEEVGRMYGTDKREEQEAIEEIRLGLERALGSYVAFRGLNRDSYRRLAEIVYREGELPCDFLGQGRDTRLVLGNHGKGVVVEGELRQ